MALVPRDPSPGWPLLRLAPWPPYPWHSAHDGWQAALAWRQEGQPASAEWPRLQLTRGFRGCSTLPLMDVQPSGWGTWSLWLPQGVMTRRGFGDTRLPEVLLCRAGPPGSGEGLTGLTAHPWRGQVTARPSSGCEPAWPFLGLWLCPWLWCQQSCLCALPDWELAGTWSMAVTHP